MGGACPPVHLCDTRGQSIPNQSQGPHTLTTPRNAVPAGGGTRAPHSRPIPDGNSECRQIRIHPMFSPVDVTIASGDGNIVYSTWSPGVYFMGAVSHLMEKLGRVVAWKDLVHDISDCQSIRAAPFSLHTSVAPKCTQQQQDKHSIHFPPPLNAKLLNVLTTFHGSGLNGTLRRYFFSSQQMGHKILGHPLTFCYVVPKKKCF
uniref:Uncharacterized protein n=1 Tax=Eutreptiella gymnastica TaxID=73025 RepID=A0A7S4LHD7_9EUGL|mmetsp:Transcript_14980/g.24043  ORF Transcript_14980/g.24043 Transcript_14980/m.24043 type:complete len:203 (+) Transcript_14980:192-800(+)